MKLTKEEHDAIAVLSRNGWQVVYGAHLEDWDEGQSIKNQYGDADAIETRSDIAVILVGSPATPE